VGERLITSVLGPLDRLSEDGEKKNTYSSETPISVSMETVKRI